MFEEFFRRRRFHKLERESQLDFRIGDIGIDGPKLTRRKNAMRQLHSLFAEESYPVLLRCLADRRVGPVATELFAQDGPAGFDAVRDAAARSKDAMLHANAVKVVANEAVSHLDFLEEELAWGLEQGATDLWSEVANTLVDCGAEDRVVSHAAAALADQSRDESTQLEVLYALRDLGTRPSIEALAAAVMDSGDDSYVQKRLRATIEELKRPESVADVEALTDNSRKRAV